uniref:GTP binding protein 1 n=1 Tax=Hucho hucho TaxID=62062 RepID=A0A4W5M412_9TELE
MASLAAHEPSISPNSIPVLADALMPASIFAPEGGGCGDHDAGEECFEDGDLFNGEAGDLGIDFTSKLALVSPNGEQYDSLLRQLRERMDEGCGETIYVVGMVITKPDFTGCVIVTETLKLLQRLLKSPGCRKIPVLVQNKDDVIVTASNFSSERMCPIFQISNVTGENMDLLKMFLNLLSSKTSFREDEPAEFQIDDTYSVPGVGTVVSGTTLRGLIRLNDTMLLGPDPLGSFLAIAVKSIHRKRMPVKEVRGGQTASFALKKIKRSSIRKGMVMVSPRLNPQASWEFMAEILVLHHPTTISPRYQAMVHCGSIRQTATILTMNRDCLRTGDKASVHFRFIKTPEYLHTEQRLVFREGRTKAVGTITKLLQSTNNLPSNFKPPQIKMQSTKKAPYRREDGATPANEDEASTARPDSPHQSQQPTKSGGGSRRRGGQRHKGKSNQSSSTTAAPSSAGTGGS